MPRCMRERSQKPIPLQIVIAVKYLTGLYVRAVGVLGERLSEAIWETIQGL